MDCVFTGGERTPWPDPGSRSPASGGYPQRPADGFGLEPGRSRADPRTPELPAPAAATEVSFRVGSRSTARLRRRARRVGRAHQGGLAAVHSHRRPPRAHRPRRRSRRSRPSASRSRSCRSSAPRSSSRSSEADFAYSVVGPRPLPRQRDAPARLGRTRAAARAERDPDVRGARAAARRAASSPSTSAASCSSPARPVRARRRRSAR